MSAIFRHKAVAGNTIGASKSFGYFMAFLTICLVLMNAYHLSNFLVTKLTDPTTNALVIWILKLIGFAIACLEIPVAKSLVTSYRLDRFSLETFIQGLLTAVIVTMAVVAGISSQMADQDRRDTQTASYNVSASSFDRMKRSAAITRDSAIARANRIQDLESKQIAILDAKSAYQNTLVSISQKEAAHTLTRPVQMTVSGSDDNRFAITLFSLICSLGAIYCSAFSAVFINPLTAMPAFSLRSKKGHDWQSDGSDFQTVKHELSPLANRFTGYLSREKVPAKALPRTAQSDNITRSESGTTDTRPTPIDTTLGAESNIESIDGVRTPNEATKKPAKVDYSESHYAEIKGSVVTGNIKPTVRPVKDKLVSLNVKFVDDAARQKKAVEILDQLKSEGVLVDNPEFGKSGQVVAKYILNPDYKQDGAGDGMVRSICPDCSTQSAVSESNLKLWDSKVGCPDCGEIYKVERIKPKMKVSPVIGAGIDEDGINPVAGIGAIISK